MERGRYVEPRAFTEDEVDMVGKLYSDGVFQQTQDYHFTVLQGSCVGGSTVVNNAVSFEPPEQVLARWNNPAIHSAGLDLPRLQMSVAEVTRQLRITKQDHAPLNPSGAKFLAGAAALGLQPPDLEVDAVRANIEGCLGCGYCNMGCAFGKKLSMLDTTLPWAQREFPGRVRIVAECEVERLRAVSGSSQRVIDARATFPDGRRVTIKAKTFVLAAGAIASSYLLLRSGLGRGLPVGKHLCFNMGSPLTAEFDDEMNAYDGLQISHFGRPRPERGFVYEMWWNPPVVQAINMPGWFEDHFSNMRRYNRLMAVGALVGTASNAEVKEALTGGPDIAYTPEPADLRTLGGALKDLGKILFAGGARRVMANTWGYDVFTKASELDRLDQIALDPSYIALGTGHPQGGNALSTDPKRGVVGPDFRVHGYDNLYVCDASVFPSSLTVNPQLTIMSLAHYAASVIRCMYTITPVRVLAVLVLYAALFMVIRLNKPRARAGRAQDVFHDRGAVGGAGVHRELSAVSRGVDELPPVAEQLLALLPVDRPVSLVPVSGGARGPADDRAMFRVRRVQPGRKVRRAAPVRHVGAGPFLSRVPRQRRLRDWMVTARRSLSADHPVRAPAAGSLGAGVDRLVVRAHIGVITVGLLSLLGVAQARAQLPALPQYVTISPKPEVIKLSFYVDYGGGSAANAGRHFVGAQALIDLPSRWYASAGAGALLFSAPGVGTAPAFAAVLGREFPREPSLFVTVAQTGIGYVAFGDGAGGRRHQLDIPLAVGFGAYGAVPMLPRSNILSNVASAKPWIAARAQVRHVSVTATSQPGAGWHVGFGGALGLP